MRVVERLLVQGKAWWQNVLLRLVASCSEFRTHELLVPKFLLQTRFVQSCQVLLVVATDPSSDASSSDWLARSVVSTDATLRVR
eukprot:1135683-Amphidinium_carterae.1